MDSSTMSDVVSNIPFFGNSEEKKEKKSKKLEQVARDEAVDRFNIVRIDGVDYVTMNGYPVSLEDDAKGNLCERLEAYRAAFVRECMNKGEVPGMRV